ncbi:MAG: HD-GYP domain-containing protein [Thermodesulfovibrionia bacterium]|nr:HD-GYP domain-containing protein [Thermodesulfovibrionia bacterium]
MKSFQNTGQRGMKEDKKVRDLSGLDELAALYKSGVLAEDGDKDALFLKNREAFFNMLEDVSESYRELELLFTGLVKSMVNALDAKSPWTKGHSQRVAEYSKIIARKMDFSEDDLKDIWLAGILHDIGKIGTYDALLDKAGKLTSEEYEIIKRHPAQGAAILEGIKQLKDIVPIIRHHHESFDGKGYPDGLKGNEIPLQSRIIHVADSFDSMTSDRPYRVSPGKDYAISEFRKFSGAQFDPYAVEVFLDVIGSGQHLRLIKF